MTQEEAKAYALGGHKITHTYFSDNEYITFGKDYRGMPGYIFEDGVRVPHDWWNREHLKDGWSKFE